LRSSKAATVTKLPYAADSASPAIGIGGPGLGNGWQAGQHAERYSDIRSRQFL
jgi:hypothetical protein